MSMFRIVSILISTLFFNLATTSFACLDEEDAKNPKKKSGHHSTKSRDVKAMPTPDEGPDSHAVKIDTVSDIIKGSVSLEVNGMRCSSCKEKLEAAIKKLPEVESVTANVKEKSLTLILKSDLAKATLAKAIQDAGFSPF